MKEIYSEGRRAVNRGIWVGLSYLAPTRMQARPRSYWSGRSSGYYCTGSDCYLDIRVQRVAMNILLSEERRLIRWSKQYSMGIYWEGGLLLAADHVKALEGHGLFAPGEQYEWDFSKKSEATMLRFGVVLQAGLFCRIRS